MHQSTHAILSGYGQEQQVLDEILRAAVESIKPSKVASGTMRLNNAAQEQLTCYSSYPAENLPKLGSYIDSGPLDRSQPERIGITGRDALRIKVAPLMPTGG